MTTEELEKILEQAEGIRGKRSNIINMTITLKEEPTYNHMGEIRILPGVPAAIIRQIDGLTYEVSARVKSLKSYLRKLKENANQQI